MSTLREIKDTAETEAIRNALKGTLGNVRAAAVALAVSESTLWGRLTKLGISPADYRWTAQSVPESPAT